MRDLLRSNQKGDTIVEVLLAIAVVSSVLGGAFVSANRSLRGTQVSQERGEALKLVEGQLERLKAAASDPDPTISGAVFGATGDFCLSDTLAVTTGGACLQGGRYQLAIRRTGENFTASAWWDKFGAGGQEVVNIVYRAHQL
jgi:type II secretory pathway pseudopilin PulG